MLVMKFRKEEDAKHFLKKVKRMREGLEDMEDMLEECLEDADYRDDDDDDYSSDDRRMRRNERMNERRYRRSR